MNTHALLALVDPGTGAGGGGTNGLTNPVLPPLLGSTPNKNAGTEGTGRIVGSIINLLMVVASLLALLYLILGGLQWITSGGDKNGMESARNKISHAIIGLIIVGAAWAIWVLVGNFLGINFQNIPLPTLG